MRTPAVGAVIRDDVGRVLLVLRSHDPQAGCWTIPGGRVEPGESLEDAVAREVLEETGLRVTVGCEVWTLDVANGPEEVFEIHDFLAEVDGGELAADDDAADAGWFDRTDMERLPLTEGLLGYLTRHHVV